MASNGLTSLKLFDYSDRELLLAVDELCAHEEDGFTSTRAICESLGVTGDTKMNSTGSRLAALRRLGAIEKKPNVANSRWQVSPLGLVMATGTLTKTQQSQLDGLKPEQMILLTRFLTGRYSNAPVTAGHLIRREWVHGTKRW